MRFNCYATKLSICPAAWTCDSRSHRSRWFSVHKRTSGFFQQNIYSASSAFNTIPTFGPSVTPVAWIFSEATFWGFGLKRVEAPLRNKKDQIYTQSGDMQGQSDPKNCILLPWVSSTNINLQFESSAHHAPMILAMALPHQHTSLHSTRRYQLHLETKGIRASDGFHCLAGVSPAVCQSPSFAWSESHWNPS